ncbi:MFS transporter [Streptomyces sp. HP-A2021]|uniref:MFS transporter n=1 Tax=Streptomyces sp. HP-A2021 TaxID=2927875 RepID=UPI001FAEA0F3|nr:MFS transporter [Streptomyces sp. HP-A2021]
MLPASGWLADRIGVKNIFFTAILLFTLGSLLCARSETLNELLISRVIQGIGGAMMNAGWQANGDENRPARSVYGGDDIRDVARPGLAWYTGHSPRRLSLVEHASWHWTFLINLPAGPYRRAGRSWFLMPNYTMRTQRFDIVAASSGLPSVWLRRHWRWTVTAAWAFRRLPFFGVNSCRADRAIKLLCCTLVTTNGRCSISHLIRYRRPSPSA